jgi:hypothetical protein
MASARKRIAKINLDSQDRPTRALPEDKMKTVILLAGYTTDSDGKHGSIGAGKTTIARALANHSRYVESCEIKSFAGLLRTQIKISWSHIDFDTVKTSGKIVGEFGYRDLAESVSNGFKAIDPDIYPRYVCTTMSEDGLTIIDDCRTEQEFLFTRQFCAINRIKLIPIMLYRTVKDPVRISDMEQSIHSSANCFYLVNNDEPIDDVVRQINIARMRIGS